MPSIIFERVYQNDLINIWLCLISFAIILVAVIILLLFRLRKIEYFKWPIVYIIFFIVLNYYSVPDYIDFLYSKEKLVRYSKECMNSRTTNELYIKTKDKGRYQIGCNDGILYVVDKTFYFVYVYSLSGGDLPLNYKRLYVKSFSKGGVDKFKKLYPDNAIVEVFGGWFIVSPLFKY